MDTTAPKRVARVALNFLGGMAVGLLDGRAARMLRQARSLQEQAESLRHSARMMAREIRIDLPSDSELEFQAVECPAPVKDPKKWVMFGQTTLGGSPVGPGQQWVIEFDSGYWSLAVPERVDIQAYAAENETTINGEALAVLVTDSRSGREPNLPRSREDDMSFGILMSGPMMCDDWHRFAAVRNQTLKIYGYNIHPFPVHVCVNLWVTNGFDSQA